MRTVVGEWMLKTRRCIAFHNGNKEDADDRSLLDYCRYL